MDRITARFETPPVLLTQRLKLREMKRSDYKDMFEYASDPQVTRFLLWAPHETPEQTKRYLKQVESAYKKGQFFDFGVELRGTGKFIGTCGIVTYDLANSSAEIGYVLNPLYWGMGIAAEAASRVIAFCFDELDLHRVEARYMLGNDRSRRVMEKCGMTFEGVRRSSLFVRDGYTDVGVCSILASDPRKQC